MCPLVPHVIYDNEYYNHRWTISSTNSTDLNT